MSAVGLIGYVALAFALYTFFHDTYPMLREEHRARQRSRLECDGWTLPWFLCGVWWFGLESLTPRFLRRYEDPDAAFGRVAQEEK